VIRTAVHFSDAATFGGTERSLLYLLAGLDRRRWRPVLFHLPEPGVAPLVDEARRLGVELRAAPAPLGVRGLAGVPRLARLVRAERPAVFHAHLTYPLSCKFGLLAAGLARVPAVVATAQLFVDRRQTALVSAQHRVASASVGRFLAVSNEVANQLRRRFGVPAHKLEVVHNGIAAEPLAALAPDPALRAALLAGGPERPIVLTPARLDGQKGHRYLVEAAARVPDALFVFAGDGDERAALEAQSRSLGVSDRVRFLGYRSDVPALLAACDLFVLPSLYEGLPLSILEAMAAGAPVVASRIGGNDEAVVHGETGLLVPPADPAALAAAVRTVLGDADLGRRLVAAARARVRQEFSAEAMVRKVDRAYEELLARRGRRGAGGRGA
jgi:glycosyltransferase involved in cell wall biosynthesis